MGVVIVNVKFEAVNLTTPTLKEHTSTAVVLIASANDH